MINKIYKILISLITLFIIIAFYLSTIGIKTDKFNSRIISQIKKIEPNLELKLTEVSAKLNPFKLEVTATTIGTNLLYKDKLIKLESIKSNISLKSFLNDSFAITNISISTRSLGIKDLIIFARLFNNDPKLFIANQFIKRGFVVADIKLNFDKLGNIKSNYKINLVINDGQINLFKKYDLNKINFKLKIDEKRFEFDNVKFLLNNNNILVPELITLKENNEYLISGKLDTKNTNLSKKDISNLVNNKNFKLDFDNIIFNSKNNFRFKIDKKFKIKNLDIKSDINIEKFNIKNILELKDLFPEIQKEIVFKNQNIKLEYKKDDLSISGKGDIFLQNEADNIEYEIYKQKSLIKFNTSLNISKNPFEIELLNYKKKEDSNLRFELEGKSSKKKIIFKKIFLKEDKNILSVKNLILSNNRINQLGNIDINYRDNDNFKNNLQINKKNKEYLVSGSSFNINNIIDRLLNSKNDKKLVIFKNDLKFIFDIKNVYLDKDNNIYDLKGHLFLDNNEVSKLNLESEFTNQRKIKLTINYNGEEKITTLFSQEAKPLVNRYKFIKGFKEGVLDFYSIKNSNITNSTLKIDNFKIQEIPVLAKILTLASLQGIADLLTGEGIRFTDFEMKFSNKDKLMTIDEMYAIGPAISILMDGYIEKDKLISLRGTLVPATTINRTISSIPLIGNILVGKKVGEGVFGVSFKVKGPPKDLETTVNPIKTLTPRFITRTLEKIKKD